MRALSLGLALLCLAAHSCAQGWRVGGAGASTAAPEAPTVAAIALAIKSRAIQDSRCYLMNGGAVESFFISEDTPVGSVIGTLSVNGDPSEDLGDITLRLQEKNAAIGIAPGTKNLTLLRSLDREEKLGPSNVYVNVRCDRRRTTDPSFIIPVSVRVWDVNDNAPAWLGAPYSGAVSELAAPGARLALGLRAADADQPGPHATIHYSVLPGPHSEYVKFLNELDSTLVIAKALDYETLPTLSVQLRAQDGGTPPRHSDATLTLTVLDADDQNPKFSHEHYTAVVPDDAKEGTILETSPGPISAVDQDTGINAPLQYSATGEAGALLALQRDSGAVAVTQDLLDNLSQPVTVVIKATQVDNSDRYALATLTLRRAASARLLTAVRFRRAHYAANVSEAAPVGSVLLTLLTTASQKNLQFYVSDRSFLEKFAINSGGEVVLRRALDYETMDSFHYQVMVTDGQSNDTAAIEINVVNVNEWEPRFKHPQYSFSVSAGELGEGGGGELCVGSLQVYDGDKGDTVTLSLRGEGANVVHMNASGALCTTSAALRTLNSSAIHLLATAKDSGDPPRQTSVPVTIHLPARAPPPAAEGGAGAVLGAALGALAILVCVLAVFLYTVRRRSKQPTSPSNGGFVSHEKSPSDPPNNNVTTVSAAGGAPGPGGGAVGALRGALSAGSLLSVSAGASTILADSNSSIDTTHEVSHLQTNGTSASRQSARFPRGKVSPLSPGHGAPSLMSEHLAGGPSLMSDHLAGGPGGRSGVAWPSATIPARVKKLSWDDTDKGSGGALTDATNQPLAEHLNLTVYF